MSEVKSVFYWRDQLKPARPVSVRRGRKELDALAHKAEQLRTTGMSTKEIAEMLGITERWVQKIGKKK